MPTSLHSWHIREEQEPGAACHRPNVGLLPDTRPIGKRRKMTRWAMCGRLRVVKGFPYDAVLVVAAMCSAFACGSLGRWP